MTLSLTAEPDIAANPTDIVLVLDRSGSMAGAPLAELKKGVMQFIDIIDESTDGVKDGQIGGGSHIGIVSFASTATQDTQLITSVSTLKAAVNGLSSGGSTNHADAFTKAVNLFNPASSNAKVIVLFTDGKPTTGVDPSPIAAAARAQGITIYSIGLDGSDGLDVDALEDWSSKPSSTYVAITPDESELIQIFENLARSISKPGATDIVITDVVNPCFRIVSLNAPSKGSAMLTSNTELRWTIDELGVTKNESASLEFTVRHTGTCSGIVEINENVTYHDREGNQVTFPSPEMEVDCGIITHPESCPLPVEIGLDGCEDTLAIDAGSLVMESLGRILELDVTVKNVCPHKRVALAAILTEVDTHGIEHRRGMKLMTVPAHNADSCRDISVKCIKFVLPEDLNVSGTGCGSRNLRARFIAHYVDSGYDCCHRVTAVI